MCSNECPCDAGVDNKIENMWKGYGSDFLSSHNRALDYNSMNDA